MKWLLASVVLLGGVWGAWNLPTASSDEPVFIFPRIEEHGQVVQLPNAVAQPKPGSKICVDLTAGGEADKINPAVAKVARFVNIYAGAGKNPATVKIAVVLHGKATFVCLSDEAYAKRFETKNNPTLDLIRDLKAAGVEFCVCGQSAAASGIDADDLAPEVELAVSALTANVNLQSEGFAFIPMN